MGPTKSKITAICYLPAESGNDMPVDSLRAHARVRVEGGGPESTISRFDHAYDLTVYTPQAISDRLASGTPYIVERGVLIVKEFNDKEILPAINEILPEIEYYARKIE